MSFLNPVNEPVKRFSSTDAGAPQINYNARVAGDVKTVLKACLVTGYVDKASAGWSIANEVDHVAEFVSPSAAMSDYRLGVDDSLTTATTWFYQYQNARVNPRNNAPTKSFSYVDKISGSNGWQLLVTQRGFIFIEILLSTVTTKTTARLTYFGRVKSALLASGGQNIAFYNIGYAATISSPNYFHNSGYAEIKLESYDSYANSGLAINDALTFTSQSYTSGIAALDLVSRCYLKTSASIAGQLPAIWSAVTNNSADLWGVSDTTLGGNAVVKVPLGFSHQNLNEQIKISRVWYVDLTAWEY